MSDVRQFYDANTVQFLVFGSGQAIHRELYGPGVSTKAQALDYAHSLVADQIALLGLGSDGRVLDLGCGVGAALRYLARRTEASLRGVTISPRQVSIARQLTARANLSERVSFSEADFLSLPADLTGFDVAFSIEAFIHSPSAQGYFASAAAALRPGGRLVIVDDFLVGDRLDPAVRTASEGWHYDSLLGVDDARNIAAAAGLTLVQDTDLTPYQRLGRPRDKLIRVSQPVLRRLAPYSRWCQMLVGGDAVQACHQRGLFEYHELVFARG